MKDLRRGEPFAARRGGIPSSGAGGRVLDRLDQERSGVAHRRCRRQPGGGYAVLQCGRHLGPLQRRRYDPGTAQRLPELGSRLLSTGGNVLAEIIADTVGRHDTLGGACASESNTVRYALDKRTMHSCRDSFVLAVAKQDHLGISKRDLSHNVNFS